MNLAGSSNFLGTIPLPPSRFPSGRCRDFRQAAVTAGSSSCASPAAVGEVQLRPSRIEPPPVVEA
uniref:Uncharacterized protein n=1 Tax=Arundo donax TaxID=35708 RepID=A0A0A8ZJP3_ARUDO